MIKCRRCGADNSDEMNFCRNCGAPLKAQPAQQRPAAQAGQNVRANPNAYPNQNPNAYQNQNRQTDFGKSDGRK